MNRNKRFETIEKLKLGTWSIRGLANKEDKLQNELKRNNIDRYLHSDRNKEETEWYNRI